MNITTKIIVETNGALATAMMLQKRLNTKLQKLVREQMDTPEDLQDLREARKLNTLCKLLLAETGSMQAQIKLHLGDSYD